MDLVERYLHAIRVWLPLGAPRDDILRELSDDIHSEIEERRRSGDALDEPEIASILKARGHPMAVAARFVSGDALVGPVLYPVFRLVLRIVLGYVLLPAFGLIALGAMITSAHPLASMVGVAFIALQVLFMSFGVIVLIFAILERQATPARMLSEWDPRRLPRVRDAGRVSRWNAVLVAVTSAILAGLFAAIAMGLPRDIPGLEAASLGGLLPGPVWSGFFENTWRMIVAVSLVNFALGVMMAARPAFVRIGTGARAIADALMGIVVLAGAAPYVVDIPTYRQTLVAMGDRLHGLHALSGPASPSQVAQAFGPALDVMVVLMLLAIGAICLVSALMEGWRYRKLQGARA